LTVDRGASPALQEAFFIERGQHAQIARYQALPGNADPEALPPLSSQLKGERTLGGRAMSFFVGAIPPWLPSFELAT